MEIMCPLMLKDLWPKIGVGLGSAKKWPTYAISAGPKVSVTTKWWVTFEHV